MSKFTQAGGFEDLAIKGAGQERPVLSTTLLSATPLAHVNGPTAQLADGAITDAELGKAIEYLVANPHRASNDLIAAIGSYLVETTANEASVRGYGDFRAWLDKHPGTELLLNEFVDRVGILQGRRWVPDLDVREAMHAVELHQAEVRSQGIVRRVLNATFGIDQTPQTKLLATVQTLSASRLALEKEVSALRATRSVLADEIHNERMQARTQLLHEVEELVQKRLTILAEMTAERQKISDEIANSKAAGHTRRDQDARERSNEEQRHLERIGELKAAIRDLELRQTEVAAQKGVQIDDRQVIQAKIVEITNQFKTILRSFPTRRYASDFLKDFQGAVLDTLLPNLKEFEDEYGAMARANLADTIAEMLLLLDEAFQRKDWRSVFNPDVHTHIQLAPWTSTINERINFSSMETFFRPLCNPAVPLNTWSKAFVERVEEILKRNAENRKLEPQLAQLKHKWDDEDVRKSEIGKAVEQVQTVGESIVRFEVFPIQSRIE